MRFLAVITLLILVMAQPVAAQTFKPDLKAGVNAYNQKDYVTALFEGFLVVFGNTIIKSNWSYPMRP